MFIVIQYKCMCTSISYKICFPLSRKLSTSFNPCRYRDGHLRYFAYSWASTLVGVHHNMSHALICKCKSTVFVYVNETQYMCIDFDGHHYGGSFILVSFLYDILIML